MRRYIAISLGALVVLGVVAAGIVFRHARPSPAAVSDDAAAIKVLQACTDPNSLISCARPTLLALLQEKSGSAVMDILSENLRPQWCHYMGHVVGQDLYKKYGSAETALANCNNDCESACTHGVVGEAFVEEAGISDRNFDAGHLSPQQVLILGSKLCSERSICHAAGHALFLGYQTIASSTRACETISTGAMRSNCISGIFMEYSNELGSLSAWKDGPSPNVPPPAALGSFCLLPTPEEREGCFAYFPAIAVQTLMPSAQPSSAGPVLEKVRDMCVSLSNPADRYNCIVGVGEYGFGTVLAVPRPVSSICDSFSSSKDKMACVTGMIYRADRSRGKDRVISYCASLTDAAVRSSCYVDAFSFLSGSDAVAAMAKLCPQDDGLCTKAATDHATHAWTFIVGPQMEQ